MERGEKRFLAIAALFLGLGCLGKAQLARVSSFSDLGKNGTRIALCNPAHCPAGEYASMALSNVGLSDPELERRIRANIATNDPDVRAVLDKVVAGEVDAGFVYITDAYEEGDKLRIIEIPREFLPLPQYGVSIINGAENRDGAELFITYLLSREGQETLRRFGFVPAIDSPAPFEEPVRKGRGEIVVYAAASLRDVLTELSQRFMNRTGVEVVLGFGSSGMLRERIEGGAPADVYASASLRHAEALVEEGLAESYTVFARNHLVVVARR